jgi:hypothetical protein
LPKQQGDVAQKEHVAKVCFRCFRDMLQVFYIDVAKVDPDMFHMLQWLYMYVASVSCVCCKSTFGYCIYMHVASICFKCFKCFTTIDWLITIINWDTCYGRQPSTTIWSSGGKVSVSYFPTTRNIVASPLHALLHLQG